MTPDNVLRLAELEGELADAARRALDTATKRESRRLIRGELVSFAIQHADGVAGLEGTNDPFQIARNHLQAAATDERPEYAKRDDAYAQKARARSLKLPDVMSYLVQLEDRANQLG